MDTIHFRAVGADPEVFLTDKKGIPVSAEGKFGGTKEEPLLMDGVGEGFFIQEDNVTAEFNIPASLSAKQFSINIMKGLSYVTREAKKKGLKVALEPALYFTEEQLSTPHAQHLGCDPDFNIWTLNQNPRPQPPKSLRTAAGHVHVSWDAPQNDQVIALVRSLDLTLGIPSILVTKKSERRSLYGRAGAFRPKRYGCEYRTLENFWLGSRDWCSHIFTTVEQTISTINNNGEFFLDEVEAKSVDIQNAINEHDPDLALKLMANFGISPFPIHYA